VRFFFIPQVGFEQFNATVRWTVACRQLDDGNTLIFISAGNENANKSLLRCLVFHTIQSDGDFLFGGAGERI